ncbi:unnamed protein product [Acidithrix sp. C25]|nr:unnamed protein product [Acidithrix sp. C25]
MAIATVNGDKARTSQMGYGFWDIGLWAGFSGNWFLVTI